MTEAPAPAAPAAAKPLTEAERALELVNKLWSDSTVGKAVRSKARELYPDAPPTVDEQLEPLMAPVREELAAMTEKLRVANEEAATRAQADADARAELAMRGEWDQAKTRFRLNEAGEELTLKLMRERGLTSPMAAAALVVADNPPPKDPSGYLGPQNVRLFGPGDESHDQRIKLLLESPNERFIDAEFRDFLADPHEYMQSAGIPDWQIQASIG